MSQKVIKLGPICKSICTTSAKFYYCNLISVIIEISFECEKKTQEELWNCFYVSGNSEQDDEWRIREYSQPGN